SNLLNVLPTSVFGKPSKMVRKLASFAASCQSGILKTSNDKNSREKWQDMRGEIMRQRNHCGAVTDKLRGNSAFMILPLMILLVLSSSFAQSAENVSERLPRTNLLVYHDAKKEVLPVKSRRDWEKRRAEILDGCQKIMGPLPGKERRCAP